MTERSAELVARLGILLLIAAATITLDAQTIINPTRIEFDSPDHHVVLPSGEPAISQYVLEVWPRTGTPGDGSPVATLDLGKPAISSGSTAISMLIATFLLNLGAGSEYVATVRAVGPAGESRSALSNEFIRLNGPTPPSPPVVTDPANEVVIYAGDVQPSDVHGRWELAQLAGAAGDVALFNSNLGEAKPAAASETPVNYVEFTFTAAAGVPYRLWMRMRAADTYYGNDSVFVQFTGSVDANNAPVYRIGTTDGAAVILEEGHGAGLAGWGWNDHSYGGLSEPIYFAASGPQVVRIQQREDGVYFDQIVMSAGTFYSTPPGSLRNDTTIVPKQ